MTPYNAGVEPVLLDITAIVRPCRHGGATETMSTRRTKPGGTPKTPHPLESPDGGMVVINKSFL